MINRELLMWISNCPTELEYVDFTADGVVIVANLKEYADELSETFDYPCDGPEPCDGCDCGRACDLALEPCDGCDCGRADAVTVDNGAVSLPIIPSHPSTPKYSIPVAPRASERPVTNSVVDWMLDSVDTMGRS